jgi:hypothetical protein
LFTYNSVWTTAFQTKFELFMLALYVRELLIRLFD